MDTKPVILEENLHTALGYSGLKRRLRNEETHTRLVCTVCGRGGGTLIRTSKVKPEDRYMQRYAHKDMKCPPEEQTRWNGIDLESIRSVFADKVGRRQVR